jgi:hypothetical protein
MNDKYKVTPKAENANKGFHYTVTEEQIKEHQQRSLKDIFEWLEKTNKFIYTLQTPEEREMSRKMKNMEE